MVAVMAEPTTPRFGGQGYGFGGWVNDRQEKAPGEDADAPFFPGAYSQLRHIMLPQTARPVLHPAGSKRPIYRRTP